MKRMHLFEFTDLPWYPQEFRRIQTDYLQFVTSFGSGHKNLIPLFVKTMQSAKTTEIVDLCSGTGGPWMKLMEHFKQSGFSITVKLTDKYPHPDVIQKWQDATDPGIEYYPGTVDAMNVPPKLKGMRTFFEGFHHFAPQQALSILEDAVEKKVAIGIFEASLKPPLGWLLLLMAPVTTLIGYLFVTPFIKPRTWSRFFWTYLVPIVPLATCWDGVISFLRVYLPPDLRELLSPLQRKDYVWEIGQVSSGTPVFDFTYLLGYPVAWSK